MRENFFFHWVFFCFQLLSCFFAICFLLEKCCICSKHSYLIVGKIQLNIYTPNNSEVKNFPLSFISYYKLLIAMWKKEKMITFLISSLVKPYQNGRIHFDDKKENYECRSQHCAGLTITFAVCIPYGLLFKGWMLHFSPVLVCWESSCRPSLWGNPASPTAETV